jgi:hypothetical protein
MLFDLEFDKSLTERVIESNHGKITVKLGPLRPDGHGHWYCPYRIEGLPDDNPHKMYGAGLDGIDALICSFANLGAYLESRRVELGLDFYEMDRLGFLDALKPPLSNWTDSTPEQRDAEIAAFFKEED